VCEELIEIETEKFYILRSKERFRLPNDVAVYGQAVTETLGEIRIHYAGFVHPLFGFLRKDNKGTPLTFEVRGHNVRSFLRDGEALAKIRFYRMSAPHKLTKKETEKAQDDLYQNQELQLSSYFKKWI
jgi:dCTP deaminase